MFRIVLLLVILTLSLKPQVIDMCGCDIKTTQELYTELFKTGPTKSNRVTPIPDLTEISRMCPRSEFFYSMNKNHMLAVSMLKGIFDDTNSVTEGLEMMLALRDRPEINQKVWNFALESYLYNRPEMQHIHKQNPWESTPDNFINSDYLRLLRERNRPADISSGECVLLDERFGADNGIENILWYWREDIMLNAYHWYWHLVYSLAPPVKLDRAGELFYYFHEGVMSRYNTERLANGLPRTQPFNLHVGALIEHGYNTHLKDDNSGYSWSGRRPNTVFSDVDRPAGNHRTDYVRISVRSMVTAQDRILAAIDDGFVVATNGTRIPLTPYSGIDILADIVVAINESVNPNFYGINRDGLHNSGHDVLGLASDPRNTRKLPPGPMDDFGTSMRDVMFYPWHEYIRDIFDRHKSHLRPYTPIWGDFPLHWMGIYLSSIQVIGQTDDGGTAINQMETFWNTRRTHLSHGLDFFQNQTQMEICVKHLDHREFTYKIEIERDHYLVPTSNATVRIYLAPRYDELGYRFSIVEQRKFFFALDTFTTSLKSGLNTIWRESTESTVTLPWQDTYTQIERSDNDETPNCGCGWPHHLLLPKGTIYGADYDLFVMVTNGDSDAVFQTTDSHDGGNCKSAYVYCGLVNQKYPDAKPMGYPFDRLPYNWSPFDPSNFIPTLDDYMAGITNMGAIEVEIFHRED